MMYFLNSCHYGNCSYHRLLQSNPGLWSFPLCLCLVFVVMSHDFGAHHCWPLTYCIRLGSADRDNENHWNSNAGFHPQTAVSRCQSLPLSHFLIPVVPNLFWFMTPLRHHKLSLTTFWFVNHFCCGVHILTLFFYMRASENVRYV